jgi:eukaryotic translation initiation factor 2C
MGALMQVLAKEYTAIREAGLELEAGYTPPITYVTVLKRHRARLFPTDENTNDGSGNVRPGTCVDAGIALASGFDFYLNSHKGIQGTVKPAHYHVLHDENGFGQDAIEVATYWLCYSFCRCTRSVSYCPPAYYAHLVAERGRVLLDRDNISEDFTGPSRTAPSTSSGGADASTARPAPAFHGPHASLRNRMFFC